MVTVVDHQPGLTAVDADILAGDEAGFGGCQKQHHIGNVQRVTNPPRGLLEGIGAFVNGIGGIDPAGGDVNGDDAYNKHTKSSEMSEDLAPFWKR